MSHTLKAIDRVESISLQVIRFTTKPTFKAFLDF